MTPRLRVVAAILAVALTLALSACSPLVRVPDTVGTALPDARRAIAAHGLETGTITDFQSSVATPVVYSQDPDPGRWVLRGTKVDLILARECVRCR